ncbi:MAG: exodeoxyribonuclease III [Nitrospirae bacterium]|nr:MAG: exodeoxyribonuclease III [Nitrospirota bacterium]
MKVATFNVNSIRRRLDTVVHWLTRHQPDILCLQETKVQDKDFPVETLAAAGYHARFRGMKGYNGVAVLSRTPPEQVTFGLGSSSNADTDRFMRVVIHGITIINTYVPQGSSIRSPRYQYKLDWFARLREYFATHYSPHECIVWCGDMNVAPTPLDVYSPHTHLNHVCFHEAVREAYRRTVQWGFEDVFRRLHPNRQEYTFWDYRQPCAVRAHRGWRLDHILATRPLAIHCTASEVDLAPRLGSLPSDHTIVWAMFSW